MWRHNQKDELYHYGVLGMKWGRRKSPTTLSSNKSDLKATKKVKNDYNKLSNKEFRQKYYTSKKKHMQKEWQKVKLAIL